MSTAAAALLRHELRVLRRDPSPLVLLVCMPLVMMPFGLLTFRSVLRENGIATASGAEQVVPGAAAGFAFFLVNATCNSMFRDHGWSTWPRLRMAPIRSVELLAGKVGSLFVIGLLQQAVILGLGIVAFGLHIEGSFVAVAVLSLLMVAVAIAFAMALVGLFDTAQKVYGAGLLVTVAFAGLGGALTPTVAIPDWARALGPATPTFWAMRGFNRVVIEGGGLASIGPSVSVLVGFLVLFGLVARAAFRVDATKIHYS